MPHVPSIRGLAGNRAWILGDGMMALGDAALREENGSTT
jgi:hypothetical protein